MFENEYGNDYKNEISYDYRFSKPYWWSEVESKVVIFINGYENRHTGKLRRASCVYNLEFDSFYKIFFN